MFVNCKRSPSCQFVNETVALDRFAVPVITRFGAIVTGVAGAVSLVVPPIPDTTGGGGFPVVAGLADPVNEWTVTGAPLNNRRDSKVSIITGVVWGEPDPTGRRRA